MALTGLLTIDGITLLVGDRVLVKAQTDPVQNGLYTAAAGAWSRTADALSPNTFVFVSKGSTLAKTGWTISTNGAITPGTTPIAWAQFAGGGGGGAGAGLAQNGANLDIVAADGSIVIIPDSITVGLVPISKGGTGATTAAAARTARRRQHLQRAAARPHRGRVDERGAQPRHGGHPRAVVPRGQLEGVREAGLQDRGRQHSGRAR
ncbi:hypothetical protein ETD86_19795 [Nonomuraea turkmeniaca]|uniref:Uncharacterized protein n=1 Tax=Nonomuraea turkmeniaca TaxID=103838 RepID=A0A5S4FHZ6_9ACTN|nr:hypothetical protein ETD86_19795 [Nonomuraea turkmeniaca]